MTVQRSSWHSWHKALCEEAARKKNKQAGPWTSELHLMRAHLSPQYMHQERNKYLSLAFALNNLKRV